MLVKRTPLLIVKKTFTITCLLFLSAGFFNPVLAQESSASSEDFQLAYAFTFNMNSTKESQDHPFREKLSFNYSPNPSLRFLEGKELSESDVQSFVRRLLGTSKLKKLTGKKWVRIADQIWINTPAKNVLSEAQSKNISMICYLNMKSCALVQAINQGKTLWRYDRDKPEKTIIHDYFYNIRGDVALIRTQQRKIVFQRTLAGLDFLPPTQTDVNNLNSLFYLTAEKLGDTLFDVIKENQK